MNDFALSSQHSCPLKTGRPQESKAKNADEKQPWTYSPGAYPPLDAAIDLHAAAHGTIWAPHLLGPDFPCFEDFIKNPEVIGLWPIGSDARFLLEELWTLPSFRGCQAESRRALIGHIRQSALYLRRGSYRYVYQICNSIWRHYEGLLAARKANLKALEGTKARNLRADERKTKDALRKAASRRNDPEVKRGRSATKAQNWLKQAKKLRAEAERKQAKAEKWRISAEAMKAKAAALEAQAANLFPSACTAAGGNDATAP